ncbi:MAG: hypothetical protein M0C28_39340 [Candidatus Moduliflexus flocculans]|nr:hypothetical protein [Candidatus Moduliflexus flocculans]
MTERTLPKPFEESVAAYPRERPHLGEDGRPVRAHHLSPGLQRARPPVRRRPA